MDGLDRKPLVPNNICSGEDAILGDQFITSHETCAANDSIAVEGTTSVDSGGYLELISPEVSFSGGFAVAGQLSVRSLRPLPSPE